jgi:hypothetical protein
MESKDRPASKKKGQATVRLGWREVLAVAALLRSAGSMDKGGDFALSMGRIPLRPSFFEIGTGHRYIF